MQIRLDKLSVNAERRALKMTDLKLHDIG